MELSKEDLQKYFAEIILDIRNMNHKGNNLLFELNLENDKRFLLKKYSKIHMDDWDRGRTEFKALSHLWKKGFKDIPEPIKFDKEEDIGIYSFEEGKVLKSEEIKEKDMDHVTDFLAKLHNLKKEDKEIFGPASSACLCLQDYLEVIDKRLERIIDFKAEDEAGKKARDFLDEKVIPKIKEIKQEFLKKIREKNLDLKEQLNIDEQVLTPADFGFHNILVNDKEYKFIDFEYFGRDDPARQILDFIHHAKSSKISKELKDYFLELYKKKRDLSEEFEERLRILGPLIAITWVLIPLNILSEKQMQHAKFAQGNVENLIEERLKTAEEKFKSL